jgi:hypothetical protein
MERQDDTSRAEDTRDAAAEQVEGQHPASPEQGPGEGFAKGVESEAAEPGQEERPDFARGIDQPRDYVQRRFSEGVEQTPEDDPDKNVERRFSEGIERSPTSE